MKRLAIDSDLLLAIIYALTTAASAFLPVIDQTPIVTALGMGMVLFVPGYALVAALFPGPGDIGDFRRIVLSSWISLMAAALAGTALYVSPLGFTPGLLYICLAALTVACVILAMRRRPAAGYTGWLRADFLKLFHGIQATGRLNTALILFFMICILASVLFLSYAVLVPKQGEAFTEFYVLGPDGKAGSYPARLHLGDSSSVIVGVANHEHRDVAYDLVVLLNDSVNSSRLCEESIMLQGGETWEKKIELKPDLIGTGLKIELLLYVDGNYTAPYRDLHLWVDVRVPLY